MPSPSQALALARAARLKADQALKAAQAAGGGGGGAPTNAQVNTAISANPALTRAALALGSTLRGRWV